MNQDAEKVTGGNTSRSEPDPTTLTTQNLQREIASLKELVLTIIGGMQQAIEVSHADLVRVPTDVQKQVGNLKELHDEKFASVHRQLEQLSKLTEEKFKIVDQQFKGVENQFSERDVRVKDSAAAATTAINAALQSQKEAAGEQAKTFTLSVDKSEKATKEQIDQQRLLQQTNYDSLNDKISMLDGRVTRSEGTGQGKKDFWGIILGAAALISALISIFLAFSRR